MRLQYKLAAGVVGLVSAATALYLGVAAGLVGYQAQNGGTVVLMMAAVVLFSAIYAFDARTRVNFR